MNPIDLLSPGFLQLLTAILTFVAATITLIVVIIESCRRQFRMPPENGLVVSRDLPLRPRLGSSAMQLNKTHMIAEANDEGHAAYEKGYQASKGEEPPLQQKQQGR